jgi:hypothetical protein
MSNTRKSFTVDKLEDFTLGAFSNVRPSETLDHLIRYLSTWNGSECVISFFSITGTQTRRIVVVTIASYSWYVSLHLNCVKKLAEIRWFAKKKKKSLFSTGQRCWFQSCKRERVSNIVPVSAMILTAPLLPSLPNWQAS